MELNQPLQSRIESLVESDRVVLFMKGTRMQPMCGFSAATIGILDSLVPEYTTFNVLEDQGIREGVKAFSDWPTIPQLYIDKEFVGGLRHREADVQQRRAARDARRGGAGPDPARDRRERRRRRHHRQRAPGQSGQRGAPLHRRTLAALVQPRPDGGTRGPGGVERGSRCCSTWRRRRRRRGCPSTSKRRCRAPRSRSTIPTHRPPWAECRRPSLPPRGAKRPPLPPSWTYAPPTSGRGRSSMGSIPLDEEGMKIVAALAKDTKLVFYCHTGVRSRSAAEHFRTEGFTDVHNLEGGIDAWSREVDASVPRY